MTYGGLNITPLANASQSLELARLVQIKVESAFTGKVFFPAKRKEMFFTGSGLRILRLDLHTGENLNDLVGITQFPPIYMAISPNEKLLAANDSRLIHIWDLDSGELIASLQASPLSPSSLFFHPDTSDLIATFSNGKLVKWDGNTWQEIETIFIPKHLWQILYDKHGETMVLDNREGRMPWIDWDGNELGHVVVPSGIHYLISTSPEGSKVMILVNRVVKIYELTSGEEQPFLPLEDVLLVSITPDWELLAVLDTEMRLRLIDVSNQEILLEQDFDISDARYLSLSPDGNFLGLYSLTSIEKIPHIELWALVDQTNPQP
jgi:WD40 repeat protein